MVDPDGNKVAEPVTVPGKDGRDGVDGKSITGPQGPKGDTPSVDLIAAEVVKILEARLLRE